MPYKTPEDVMRRVREHHNIACNLGYEVVGTFLQGSWNYGNGLSDEQSDVDTKCLVVPKFKEFCLNKQPVSLTHVTENNEHIDIKDIRLYMNNFKKQNVNFVEILFTQYNVVNPTYEYMVQNLFDQRETIGHYDNYATLNCISGMAKQKEKALCRPYPSLVDKIEKYGFDGKQLSHIVRLNEFMDRWIAGEPYEKCLISNQPLYLRELKRNQNISLDEAKAMASRLSKEIYDKKQEYMSQYEHCVNHDVEYMLEEVVTAIIEKSLYEELYH